MSASERVDVRDVLARTSAGLWSVANNASTNYSTAMRERAEEFDRAREAVAELIDAAVDVGMNRFHENPDERDRSLDLLEAAAARIGGAA